MTAEELNSYGGDNTDVKGYDYANRPIYADEVANHPERKKIFKNIVDKRVVADASEPFAKLDKDGNIVGIPNDNSAPKDVGKVYNNDKTNREKYTRTPLQEGYNREKALEEKKNKLREEYSTTLKPEIDTEVDDEVINAINEKRFIQDEYNRQKAERERLIAGNNKNPRWYEGRVGLVNTDMIDKANELSWKQIEGYDLDNADQRALAILKLSLPYSRARQSYVNRAKTISDRANQQGKGSMWQGVVDNLADFTGLDEAFSAIEMGKSARHYIQAYERFNKIYNNSDQAREKAIQSLNKEDRANLEVFTAVQQVLAGNENELSYWYQAGQVTGDMLPFMLQLGASSTIVKGAGKLLRGGAKKIAEKQMAKGISTALLNTVVSPATQRAKNEEYANIRLFENRDITAKDRAKVYGQQAIENLTETVGVPFAKLGVQGTQRLFKGIGAKMLEKPMINRTFGKITKFAERPQQWIKIANKLGNNPVSKFLKDNLFFGGFGEEAFEEVEGALGNTVLGYLFDDEEMKQEFSNFWQADNLSVLALGLAPMTMFPLSFGISNAVVSHRDAKAYQQAREQLLGALRQAGLGNKKIIDGLEGKIIEGKPHEVIETLSALRRAAQGAQNEKDIDEAIYNYIAGARRLSEQRNELNAQLQQMNNAQRKEYVDNIIENIHRQQKNNILYQGIKNGYYQELQDPDTGKREKYICEVYNKNGTSIGFITDKEQDDNGNVLFTIVDGLGQVQRMTLDDIYRQAEGGEDANNPIVFTKVRDILDYLYEQAGEDEELRADIQTRNLLQDAIKRGADGSNVINVARLNDGGIMFLTDINEQAGTVTGLVQTQDGAYQPQQISLSEVAEAKEQNVEDLIDNTANIFNANIEADGILPQYTMPYYSSDKQDNNKKEEIKITPEETEKQRTTEEKESAFTVGDKVAVSVDKGNIDSYGDYGEYDGKEYEVKGVRGNQVILDIDGELRPININKQGVTLTKVEGQEEKTEAKEQGTTETEKAKEETETQKQEEKTKSLTERIKSGEILSQNAEETLVDLYSNMSKEDAQEVVNGIIKQTQDRQKQLAKKTINYEDIDKFQQHKKQVRETEKKLAYWNEVKSLFTAPLSQEEEVQSLKSIKEKESALGQAYSMREYILRNLALGAKFLWNDSENGTKGLGSHLGLREAKEERRNYYAFLNGKDRKAVYPEVYAERLLTDVRENINPNVSFDEVFNEMIDCLSSYSTPTAMMDEAVRMHYEAEDNLTQNDFEKQQQAMIDRAEKIEENRIQDELNKQEALSEEDYERMRQGFDEQEKASETDNQGNPIDEEGNLVLSHRVPNGTAEIISEDERVLVDALVDMLGETIGSENVITNEAEAKRLIDEANGEDVKYSSDKERQDLTTTIHPSSEHGAKLQINLKTAKENLKNLTDFYKGIKNSRGFIKAITTALGGNKTDTQSHYFEFNAKNGDIITLRVSNHNTNSEHYNDNEQVVSIVVKSRRHPNTFIGNANADVKEYVYFKENIKDDTLSLIAESVRDLLETGEYKDKTGIAVVNEFSRKSNNLKLHKVYHGSGADFEAFDHSHMGEGEGNQAYGWGTYVTEAEGIGRTYADTVLNRDNPHKDVKYIGDNPKYADEIAPLFKNGVRTYEEVKDFIAKSSNPRKDEHLQWFLSTRPEQWQSPNAGKRHLYTVEIPDDNGKNYLHYDKADVKTNEKVKQELITKLLQTEEYKGHEKELKQELSAINENTTGRGLYGTLQSYLGDKEASEFLSSLGFIGLSYPAQYRSGGREDGAKNYVIFNEKDLKITDKVQFFKTKDGEVFGFTVGGKIYIDTERVKADTPLHEYTHLWAEALRKVNPKAWEQLKKEMLKQTELMDYVKSNYPEIENEDALIEEVFAHYSGTQGRKRLLEEMNKEKDKQDRAIDKIKVINMFNKLKGLLDRFWNMTKDLFAGKVAGIERMTAEDFANMSLSSFLNKFNAVKVLQEATAKNTKRFGQEKEDTEIRYHISKKNNAEIERLLKKNANITDKEIEAFKQYVEHEQPVAQLSMAKWVGNGSVRLPEDKPTVDEALKICRKDKLDPMRYAAPGEIVKEWREKNIDEQEEQRQYLSPDSYPDVLTNKQDLGNGVTVYDVADTRAGQQAVRELMNSHLTVDGRYYNCWCLLYASESTGELSSQAWGYWNNYNGTQKKVAFKDGKIVSFCASSSSHSEWWDLSDKSHGDKIPVEGKIPNDKLGRSSLMEVDMQTGKATPVGRKYSGNKKNGLYREWNKDDVLVLSENYKGRKRNGLCERWYDNGQMMERSNYKDDKFNGLYEEWYSNGQILKRINYKDDKFNGLFERWYDNGQMMIRSNWKGGRYDGEYEYWYSNGQMMERINYKDGKRNGLCEEWYSNGQMMVRSNFKDGKFNGLYEEWYDNGQILKRSNWKDGERNGLSEYWYTNGQMKERSNWKDGKYNGLFERWYSNGQMMIRSNWKDGERIENLPITEDKGTPAPRWEDENERIKEDRSVKNITESESKRKGMLGVVLDALRKAIGKENVITDNRQAQRVIDEVNGRVRPEMTEDVFYSNAERSVENISQDKATPEQWLKMIEKQGGLKAGEDKWLGLSDWLKASDKKTLTKQEVLDFINENKIQIEEVTYADLEDRKAFNELQEEFDTIPFDDAEYMWEQADSRIAEFYEEMEEKYGEDYLDSMNPSERITEETLLDERERWDAEHAPDDNEAAFNAMVDKYGDDFEIAFGQNGGQLYVNNGEAAAHFLGVNPSDEVRLGYTTEGLSNKREIALTVPTIESWNEGDEIHFGDAGNGRAVAWVRFGDTIAPKKEKLIKTVTEFEEPYKGGNGRDVYMPEGERNGKDFVVYGKVRDGRMLYVPFMREQIQVGGYDTLEEARQAMNAWYKENNVGKTQYDKVLVIDEIQSKRHQEGREKGYKSKRNEELRKKYSEANDNLFAYEEALSEKYADTSEWWKIATPEELQERQRLTDARDKAMKAYAEVSYKEGSIPDAPFEKNWHEVAMKRMLRYAAENGYDKVAWTTGEQQAERYDLRKVIDEIAYWKTDDGKWGISAGDKEDSQKIDQEEFSEEELVETFGRDIADKIIKDEGVDESVLGYPEDEEVKYLNGESITIGGEGMKGFYDQMLPRFMDKYGKKWGVKTQDVELPEVEEAGRIMHSVDVTDEMRRSVMEGQPLFQRESSEEVNKRFNEELQQQIDGRLPKDHTYQLGLAGSVLQSAGVRALPIELRASRLTDKSMQENHPFELSDIKNLPNAIQEPIMVFDSANTAGRKVILTEIESKGNNFVVVLSAELKGNKISVNDIRSLYPKDSVQGIIDWINAGNLLKYADKNKALEWIGKQQSNSAEVTNTIKNLDVAAKVLQTFKNPAIIEQKNEKNLKEHRLDHQRGYTSNNGKYFSINAEDAMIDGKFPKIEFCKVYGLKKKVFDFLVDLGIIYTDGEWHHMGKTLQKKVFYWWKDRSRQDYRYDLYDNDIDIPEGSYAHIYSQNKDTIDRLIQDAEGKEWRGTKIPTLEEYIRRKRPAFIEEEWLTEQDKEERSKLHTSISANTKTPARIRYFEHKEVDERYYNIARKKFEEKYKEEDYKKQYLEEYGDKIKQNEKAFGDTESKEHTILNIFKIFAGDKSIEDEEAEINAIRERERLAKEERIRQEERRIKAEESKIKAEESKKKHQELSKKLDKWLQKQVEDGKAIKRVRIQELPEMFVTTDEEMYGRYGWFKARGTYNLPIYYSGIEFTDKRAYNYYTKIKMELNSLEADFYGVKFFKTKNGEAYGFTVGGKVYVDERIADASTPIHEYTHLWAEALRKVNPKEWQNIVSLMKKQTHLWDKVKNDYPELKTDDEIADEVLAHYSGERGKKLLDEEYNKIRGNNKMNIFDKAKMLQAINNVREALRKFWKGVADFLGIHFTSAEEVADKVLSDLLEGVNPNEVKSATDNVGTFDSENADIRFHKSTERVVEKATDEALEEVKDPILKRAYKGILKESTKDKWASFADDYHALRVMEDKVIEEMRKRDPKFRLHHSVYEQQIAAKAATQGQIFLFSQQTFKPLLDKVDKIAKKYNLSQKEVEQFMMFQFYRERTNDVIYNRWRETQDRIDAGRTPNKEYKEEYDAVKKYMGSLTDRERAEAERKANEIFGKIAEEKTFGSLEEMDEEFDQLKTEMYARAAADKYRQQELWDTNNKDGIRGFAGEESMCRTALYQTIAESYFPKEKGNMTTTRLTPDEIIEKFRDMVGKDNVDELNKLSRAVTQFTLDKALETGNITREEYEKYQRQEYYVPLRGWDKDDGEVSVFGNDTSFQSVNPNAKGRTTTADNPLKYMFVIASNQIHDFNEKQAKRSLINFINEYKDIIIGANATSYWSWNDKDNNKVYDVKRPKKNAYLKGTLEFHVMNDSYERVYPKTLKDYTFTFKDGDKTYNMYLPSKYLVKILNKDKQPDGKIIQWLSKGTRFLASMRTSKNPSFVAANFSRDALVVLLLDENRSKEFPHFRKLFLENLSKMQTVWRSEWEEGKAYRGSKMDNDVQKLYNQWVYYGGMSGYSFFLDDIEKEYEKRYKDLQRRSTRSKVGQNVNPFSSRFLDIFNRFSEFTENQVRFAAFRAYLEASEIAGNPLTVQEAVYKSKEATLNFSRSGWGTRTLGKIFPFFNAAMQGIIKLARVLRYNPTRFLGAVSIAVGVGALDAFLSLILGGDDDKKNKYLQINDYVKERNLIIMRAKIPIPQELYIPFTIGVNLMEAYLGKKTVTEAASRIINALGELLPSEVGTSLGALVEYDQVNDRLKMTDHPFNTIISALAPGIVQPISDFNRNRDFMDRPILSKEPKEEGYNKKIAQAGRYDEYKTYKVFQDAAFYYNNLVSIMTKYEPISWDREYYETLVGEGNKMAKKNGEIGKLRTVSPQAMQFFFGQYLPAISNIATKVGDIQAGRKALSGENIPIADRLVVKHDKHASLYKKSSLVYDILDEQPNKKTLKKMKKAADDEHKERYDKAIQDRKTKVVERYNKNKDKLTRLRMEVKLLRIQGAVKNEKKIDELLDKQEEIYDKILRDWNKKE